MGNQCNYYSREGIFSSPLDKLNQQNQQNKLATTSSKKTLNDFQIINILGNGAFGRVVLCREKTTKKLFAMKMLPKNKCLKFKIPKRQIFTEKQILSESKHPRIVKLYYSCLLYTSPSPRD